MRSPTGEPLPRDLQDREDHILDTLQGLGMGQQLNLACRTLLAVLLLRRPSAKAPKAQREAFRTFCTEVPVWLKDEIAEIRHVRPLPKAPPRKRTSRPKVGHA